MSPCSPCAIAVQQQWRSPNSAGLGPCTERPRIPSSNVILPAVQQAFPQAGVPMLQSCPGLLQCSPAWGALCTSSSCWTVPAGHLCTAPLAPTWLAQWQMLLTAVSDLTLQWWPASLHSLYRVFGKFREGCCSCPCMGRAQLAVAGCLTDPHEALQT